MLRVYGDQISGWYLTHMSHNGRLNAYNWKGYKTPFRRSGHIQVVRYDIMKLHIKGKLSPLSMKMYKKIPTLKCGISGPIHAIGMKFGVITQDIDSYNICEIQVARGND